MEKKRWSLIIIALGLALAFSITSVEAQDLCAEFEFCDRDGDTFVRDHRRCNCPANPEDFDCDDSVNSSTNDCSGEDPPPPDPPPDGGPRIAVVSNRFESTPAAGFIADAMGGIYTKLQISKFNDMDSAAKAADLRAKFDVLFFRYGSPSSIRASWDRLELFMNADLPSPCGGEDQPSCIGGAIIFEDPSNVTDIVGLVLLDVDQHVVGDSPAIVDFDPSGPPELKAFPVIPQTGPTSATTVGIGTENDCANGAGTTRGLGFGCLANVHITFDENPGLELTPFLRLVSNPAGAVVGVYGEVGNGQILITGPDYEFHASRDVEFQANQFCLLTNEIIWVSQADTTDSGVMDAVHLCVDRAAQFLAERFIE